MTTIYNAFNKYNIAPYASSKIGIFDSNNEFKGYLKIDNLKPAYGDRLYRFGLLSDVHQQSSQTTENNEDLKNALKVFNEKESVEFTAICGDLTQNGMVSGNTEIEMYKNMVNTASPNTPVYTTSGNHDCHGTSGSSSTGLTSYISAWTSNTNQNNQHNISFNDNQTCFEFTKTLASGKKDHFIFFGMNYYSFGSSGTTTYLADDITWLTGKLEVYQDDRCFIFTHMFFPDRAGNFRQRYPSDNWLADPQLSSLESLCDSYKNTIWFSGHSHWKWRLQETYRDSTIYGTQYQSLSEFNNVWHEQSSGKGGWCAHVSGCANPIDSHKDSSDSYGWTRESSGNYSDSCSEGAIVDVYEDYVDIRGVSFKAYNSTTDYDSTYNTQYLPIATYRLNVDHSDNISSTILSSDYIFPRKGKVNTGDSGTQGVISTFSQEQDSSGNTITTFVFKNQSQGYILSSENWTSTTSSFIIKYDEVTCTKVASNGTRTEVSVDNVNRAGFYDNTSGTVAAAKNNYILTSPFSTLLNSAEAYTCYEYNESLGYDYSSATELSKYGIQFQIASTFTQENNSDWWTSGEVLGTDFDFEIKFKNLRTI